MKTVEAQIIRSRIVACKKCGQRNRLYENTENGTYRCANPDCRADFQNPFRWRLWFARVREIATGKKAAWISVAGLLICIIGLLVKIDAVERARDSAAKEAGEEKLLVEKLKKWQVADQVRIESLTAKARVALEELERRRKAIEHELVRLGIPADKAAEIINPSVSTSSSAQKIDDALRRHLTTDNRLETGSVLLDGLRQYSGKGKLTMDNGLTEDAYVKLVQNGQLKAAFYVRSHEKFTYSTISDGSYSVLYCTGFGWDARTRDFARGRHARRYDDPLTYLTRQQPDTLGITTYTDIVTLTLHKVPLGNATTSDISLEEFDRY